MEAEIRSIKKVGNDLEINLRAVIAVAKPEGASFPNRIYICKYTHRPKPTQRVRSSGDKLIIESHRGASFNKAYMRITGHHLSYQEDFAPPIEFSEVQHSNQQMDDDAVETQN